MKKNFIFIVCLFITNMLFAQQREIISQNSDEMLTQKQVTVTERWTRNDIVGTSDEMYSTHIANNRHKKAKTYVYGGNVGIAVQGGGVFGGLMCERNWQHCSSGYVGGNIFYNFPHSSGDSKFGLSAGYDYTFKNTVTYKVDREEHRDTIYDTHDLNAGIVICKYIGLGASFQLNKSFDDSRFIAGPYLTFYLPITDHFGLMTTGKYMFNSNNRWSIGSGLIFQIPTDL